MAGWWTSARARSWRSSYSSRAVEPTPPPTGPASGDAVASAREKYACAACGAEAHWNPSKQALVCPFCGTVSTTTLRTRDETTVIVEHDLDFIRDICDRLTVLDQGSVLDCGSVQHIQSSARVQEVYLRRA